MSAPLRPPPLNLPQALWAGVGLMVLATFCASGADAVIKTLSQGFAAPQILAIAASASLFLTLLANHRRPRAEMWQTGAPRAMGLRALATIGAALGFYKALALLPFAEVFLFIGLMPLMAGVFSGPILGERPSAAVWAALGLGLCGLFLLFPFRPSGLQPGHGFALLGAGFGTLSVVLCRYIARHETATLAQVFWPQAALAAAMLALWPSVALPMTPGDIGLALLYAVLVFAGRWILAAVAARLPAWLSLQLMNLQFLWMLAFGALLFAERVGPEVLAGAGLIVLAGLIGLKGEMRRVAAPSAPSAPVPEPSLEAWQASLEEPPAAARPRLRRARA